MSYLKIVNDYPGTNNRECRDIYMDGEGGTSHQKSNDHDKATLSSYPPPEIMLEREKWIERMMYVWIIVTLVAIALALSSRENSHTVEKADNTEVAAPQK